MKLTKEMLIDWIDRPPSNEDLDLIAKILNLQIELEVANEIITMNINRINKINNLENENQQLKKSIKLFTDDLANMTNKALKLEKQKDNVVELIKIKMIRHNNEEDYCLTTEDFEDLLRMLGEIDE